MSLGDWLEERSGYRAVVRRVLDEPVPGGARWSYVFGSVLVFVLAVQAVTGILMASHYAPSQNDAWASVAYLQREVSLGWFVRGLHSSGSSALVILVSLHLLQVTLWGAYRRPRELNWWVGLLMMLCLFGFALTGYLLPWDQKGYWATQVATSLLGAAPAVGPWLKALVQGGAEYGNLTLTRFYALHVLLLPAGLLLLLVVHLALFRRHGVTPGWRQTAQELERDSVPFWPRQAVRDLAAMAITLVAMIVVVLRSHGAPLEAPADPAAAYDARPEWYFLPLFQLLKYFPGSLEIVAALGAPLLVGGVLFALPLLDRGGRRDPGARRRFVGVVALLLLGAGALGLQAAWQDHRSSTYRRARAGAAQAAERALRLAAEGVPPGGGLAVYQNDPSARALALYRERCVGCHRYQGEGEQKGPDLDGWSSRGWIRAFLLDPAAPRFYGRTPIQGMKPVKARGQDLDALVEWIFAQGGAEGVDAAAAARGRALFETSGCDVCHESDGTSAGDGVPNLGGRASARWLVDFLADPGAPRFFGAKNEMPRFGGKLAPEDLEALAAWLRTERARSP